MLGDYNQQRFSEYASLYDIIIPKDNELRRLKEEIDFSFIRSELKDKYSQCIGRLAEDPVRLFKYLMLKALHPASDVDLVNRAYTDMAYKYFLNLNPEDGVVDPSLLTKFRRQRLKDKDLMHLLLSKTVSMAIEKGIIKGKTDIILDATHTLSAYHTYRPMEFLKKASLALTRACEPFFCEKFHSDMLPQYSSDFDISELKEYGEKLVSTLKSIGVDEIPAIGQPLRILEEGMEDIKARNFTCKDKDAKNGYKSTNRPFMGYKLHISMTPERIITGTVVTSGEKADGDYLPALVEQSRENGAEIDAVIADSAYSGKDNIEYCKDDIELVAPHNPNVSNGTRKDEHDLKFTYDKDADAVICPGGHISTTKEKKAEIPKIKDGKGKIIQKHKKARVIYAFSEKDCKECVFKRRCLKSGSKRRRYSYTVFSETDREQLLFEESDVFRQKIRKRNTIESLNNHLKNDFGLKKNISYGIESMEMQAAVAIYTANIKRIMKIEGK